jgi:hypothetical protein
VRVFRAIEVQLHEPLSETRNRSRSGRTRSHRRSCESARSGCSTM